MGLKLFFSNYTCILIVATEVLAVDGSRCEHGAGPKDAGSVSAAKWRSLERY